MVKILVSLSFEIIDYCLFENMLSLFGVAYILDPVRVSLLLTSISIPGRGLPTESGRESSPGSLGNVRKFYGEKF